MIRKLESILSDLQKEELIVYITSHPERFSELIHLALSNQPPHSPRAAWMLATCMTKNDSRVTPLKATVIDVIPKVIDGQQRELIKVLQHLDLSETEEGMLFDVCVQLWCDFKKISSVRFMAFNYILTICKKYPDLKISKGCFFRTYSF